jgi:hypothetical protein
LPRPAPYTAGCDGLEGREVEGFGGGFVECFGGLSGFGFFFGLGEFFEEAGDGAEGFFFGLELGSWGEWAEGGVEVDLGDGFGGFVLAGFLRALVVIFQGEAGDLEAVEEQAGAAWVEVVGGDALEDFADGELDAGALGEVAGGGEGEGGGLLAAAFAGAEVGGGDGAAGGVVVVTKIFLAKAGAGAAAAVGEDVAALEAGFGVGFGAVVGLRHGWPPSRGKRVKDHKRLDLGLMFRCVPRRVEG